MATSNLTKLSGFIMLMFPVGNPWSLQNTGYSLQNTVHRRMQSYWGNAEIGNEACKIPLTLRNGSIHFIYVKFFLCGHQTSENQLRPSSKTPGSLSDGAISRSCQCVSVIIDDSPASPRWVQLTFSWVHWGFRSHLVYLFKMSCLRHLMLKIKGRAQWEGLLSFALLLDFTVSTFETSLLMITNESLLSNPGKLPKL